MPKTLLTKSGLKSLPVYRALKGGSQTPLQRLLARRGPSSAPFMLHIPLRPLTL